jgi:hypothetical protein
MMKTRTSLTFLGLVLVLVGCTTSSRVQEMIDASYQDQMDRADSHEASIDVLRKSAMTSLEKSKENSEVLKQISASLKEINAQINLNKNFAEASKVMSAANTVKVAELDELLKENMKLDQLTKERLVEIDTLYERTMIAYYELIAESANKAIESLKSEGWIGSSNAPVQIDEPIEIIAPVTAPIINSPEKQ